MSNNSNDRRVARTRSSLHEALVRLVHEKPYDSISVGDIAARANVGRTTFYMHFAGKDELLASAIEEKLHSLRPRGDGLERIVGFARPLFEHIHGARSAHGPMASAGTQARVHERLRKAVTAAIEREVAALCSGPAASVLPDHVATTFLLVLERWSGDRLASPQKADALFRALVVPTLTAALTPGRAPRLAGVVESASPHSTTR